MKIILASDVSFVLKYGYPKTGLSKDELRIGYVTTASKGARTNRNDEILQLIKDEGYNLEEIDITGKTEDELLTFFKDKNVIQVAGGNSFYLLNAARQTDFAKVVRALLEQGKIYIGMSAGSYLMCPSIEVADWSDESISRFGVTDFSAFNYVPFVLRVHYTDDKEKTVREKMNTLHYPLRLLRDGQGIIVTEGNFMFMGDGEEVILK